MSYGFCKSIKEGDEKRKDGKLSIEDVRQRGLDSSIKRKEDNINKNRIIRTKDDKDERCKKEGELISFDQIQQEVSRVRSIEDNKRKPGVFTGVLVRTYEDFKYWIFLCKVGIVITVININISYLLCNIKQYKDL